MGNFQSLAKKVLNRQRSIVKKVSCFPTLEGETGNLGVENGNLTGNSKITSISRAHTFPGFPREPDLETNRKPSIKHEETFHTQNSQLSFLSAYTTLATLEQFFEDADRIEVQLLQDDKLWIKDICYGVPLGRLKAILCQYLVCWFEGMEQEKIQHKRQNKGRYEANSFLRQAVAIVVIKYRRKNNVE